MKMYELETERDYGERRAHQIHFLIRGKPISDITVIQLVLKLLDDNFSFYINCIAQIYSLHTYIYQYKSSFACYKK